MKNIRIYKDDIRVNVLRSLFFTDTILAMTGALFVGGTWYFLFRNFFHIMPIEYFVSILIVLEIFFLGFITQKIDNQPIYKIIPRALMFKGGQKEFRQRDLESYFVDFSVQDNHIYRKNSIIRMLLVEPFDIALLNDQDRENFFIKLKQTIHVLPSQMQFIVRKEKTLIKDYSQHFFSLYDHSNSKREMLINAYINDLSQLIESHEFMTPRHYAVFSVSCTTAKLSDRVKAIKKLNDVEMSFAGALSACNIQARSLTSNELINFSEFTLRS